MSKVITLEEALSWGRRTKVAHVKGGVGFVTNDPQTGVQRGLLGRWVPARELSYGGLVTFKRRLRNAWGVLTGRYDAFSWDLLDDPRSELYKEARLKALTSTPPTSLTEVVPYPDPYADSKAVLKEIRKASQERV